MLKIVHEGFKLELPHIKRYKPGNTDTWLILCLIDGEVDCMFTSNGLAKAKEDIAKYYAHIYGDIHYDCVAYVKKD